MNRFRDQRGQTLVMTVVFVTVLLGMSASVLDVGAWYRADRAAQATADAAALAGAQALPGNQGAAADLALRYAEKNSGGLAVSHTEPPSGDTMSMEIKFPAADTISVTVEHETPGYFSKLFGIANVTVSAKAAARAGAMEEAKWVAPVVVSWFHELMPGGGNEDCTPDPCFNQETTLSLIDLHSPGGGDAAGAFGLIDLREDGNGAVGASTLSDWMKIGFDGNMKSNFVYESIPSVMFNSSSFRSALDERFKSGNEILLPVYDSLVKSGSTAEYSVVGWVGFKITSWQAGGNGGKITGHFTRVFWDGVQSTSGDADAFGALTIQLVE